jgi:hypothetical protein
MNGELRGIGKDDVKVLWRHSVFLKFPVSFPSTEPGTTGLKASNREQSATCLHKRLEWNQIISGLVFKPVTPTFSERVLVARSHCRLLRDVIEDEASRAEIIIRHGVELITDAVWSDAS